ncbi:MAG: hypothetical protein ACO3RU_14930 [Planctomycetota bacterium]
MPALLDALDASELPKLAVLLLIAAPGVLAGAWFVAARPRAALGASAVLAGTMVYSAYDPWWSEHSDVLTWTLGYLALYTATISAWLATLAGAVRIARGATPRPSRIVLLTALVLGGSIAAERTIRNGLPRGARGLAFDPVAWQLEHDDRSRVRMLRDLTHRVLPGLAREAVLARLGEPESSSPEQMTFYLGADPDCLMPIDPLMLEVHFDAAGICIGTLVRTS